jgi:amino acid transporter
MNSVNIAGTADVRPSHAGSSDRLSGNMGVIQLAFTVLAYNAPVVVFLGYMPVTILLGNGVGTPVAYLVCAGIVGLLALGLIAMARRLDSPGGFYSFITAGLGKVVGLGSGYAALSCYYVALLGGYALGGVGLTALVHDVFHGPHVTWWVWAIILFAVASVLGYFSIELSARVLTVFLAVEIALMVFYDLGVISHIGLDAFKLNSFDPSNIWSGSIGIALLFGVGIFGGFEATVIFRDEVKSPEKTIPRATYLVVAFLGCMYAFTAWMFINSYGAKAVMAAVADPTGSATHSVEKYAGHFAYDLASTLLVTSSFALILAAHNISARYAFNLGADMILPESLSRVHHRHSSPHRASVAVSIASAIGLVLMVISKSDPNLLYAKLAGLYAYTAIVLFILVAMAITAYLFKHRGTGSQYGDGMGPAIGSAISAVFMLYALWVGTKHFDYLTGATGITAKVILAVAWGLIALGMVTAAVYRKTRPDTYARIGRQDVV